MLTVIYFNGKNLCTSHQKWGCHSCYKVFYHWYDIPGVNCGTIETMTLVLITIQLLHFGFQ